MEKKQETFTVRLNKRAKAWRMDLNYQLPISKFAEVIAYLEQFKPKEITNPPLN